MSLSTFNTAGTTGFSFSLTAVTGMQVETLSLSASPVSTQLGYDPANGACTLFGIHDGEVTTGTITGKLLGTTGLANATIGAAITSTLTAAMCTLAGYTGNNGTVVCTGASLTKTPGVFAPLTVSFSHLRAIP